MMFEGKTYEQLVAEGYDPLYAAELTGNIEAAREIVRDYEVLGPERINNEIEANNAT